MEDFFTVWWPVWVKRVWLAVEDISTFHLFFIGKCMKMKIKCVPLPRQMLSCSENIGHNPVSIT